MRASLFSVLLFLTSCAATPPSSILYQDDFTSDSHQWSVELEHGGSVRIADGAMDIDVPAGATIWFRPLLTSPVTIEYDATAIRAAGQNDRVSDLNCFWMATDSRNPNNLIAVKRTGKFADYNPLLTYYASIGGNSNTTTRFRRYIGNPTTRPILPQHDLRDDADMLPANQPIHITLIANGSHIEFRRNGRVIFSYDDPSPYTSGHFAIRTTQSHLKIQNLRISRLSAYRYRE